MRLSARNRELLNLIVVGMITGLGFASVYIARSEVVSPQSLTYAAFFLLCSDGLTSMVDDREILRLVGEKRGDLQGLVKALFKAAN